MTPRQVDVAFVLEGVPGVVDVYALDDADRFIGELCFAVKLEHGGGHLAAAHFALLRVLSHDECKTVLLFEVDLPPVLRACATRLELAVADREAASARVPETNAALQQAPSAPNRPVYQRSGFTWMIVDADADVHRALVGAFGPAAVPVIEPNPFAAFWRARGEPFDLILCDARLAFGKDGFLAQLLAFDPSVARRVVLLANEGERDLLVASLDELRCWNSFLCKPIEPDTLREILRTGSVVQRWTIPVLPARPPAALVAPRRAGVVRRVLVVDDEPSTEMLLSSTGEDLEVTVTTDEWEAVDLVASGELDLVVCSFAMRTRGGTPFYRFLWNARPEIKRRFVFIARPDVAPTSTVDGRAPAVVERPITRDVIATLVERLPPAEQRNDA